jgi:hypothetical protein
MVESFLMTAKSCSLASGSGMVVVMTAPRLVPLLSVLRFIFILVDRWLLFIMLAQAVLHAPSRRQRRLVGFHPGLSHPFQQRESGLPSRPRIRSIPVMAAVHHDGVVGIHAVGDGLDRICIIVRNCGL